MTSYPPPIDNWQPSPQPQRPRPVRVDPRITPGEAFKRGFYGGLGAWCAFALLSVVGTLLGWLVLLILGVGLALGS